MHAADTACYALTPGGAALARRLAAFLGSAEGGEGGAHVYVPPALQHDGDLLCDSLPLLVAQTFSQYRAHVFVSATGIAVRCIAPHLTHKSVDPGVLVCDENGHFVISLISGHWGGSNALSCRLAEYLGGTAVITTATDCRQLPAVDLLVQEAGCAVVDWHQVKKISGALLRGEKVQLRDPMGMLGNVPSEYFTPVCLAYIDHRNMPELDKSKPAVSVDWRLVPAADNLLRVAVPALYVGVGCRRGVSSDEITTAIGQTLLRAGLEPQALAGLASVTAKEDESGLLEAARDLQVPLRFFTPEDLSDAPTLSPSAMAAQIFGVDHISVAEGSALLAAGGDDAALLVPKNKVQERVTVAVALPEHFLPSSDVL